MNITEGDAGVAFPIHLFRIFLGGAFEDQLALSISVPSAQLVELPAIDAFGVLNNFCRSPKTNQYCEGPDWNAINGSIINDPITFVVKQYVDQFSINENDYDLALIFVTDVLYAQQIQYSYSTENGSAFSAAVTPIAALSSQTKASGATATSQTASEGGTTINVNGGAVTATATNGGATACATPAAKTDTTPQDHAAPTKPDTTKEEQAVTDAQAAAKKADDAKKAADAKVTSAQTKLDDDRTALGKASPANRDKLAAAVKDDQSKLEAAANAADPLDAAALKADKALTDAKNALATAQKPAPAAPAPAAPAPGAPAPEPKPAPKPADQSAAQDNGCQTNKPPTNNVGAGTIADAEARIQALEAKLAALNQQLGPAGGTVTIASVTEQGTVLQQTFPSPVAIGYRGFDLDLLPRTGRTTVPTRK